MNLHYSCFLPTLNVKGKRYNSWLKKKKNDVRKKHENIRHFYHGIYLWVKKKKIIPTTPLYRVSLGRRKNSLSSSSICFFPFIFYFYFFLTFMKRWKLNFPPFVHLLMNDLETGKKKNKLKVMWGHTIIYIIKLDQNLSFVKHKTTHSQAIR